MDNKKYYLYRHIRLDKNEPFYIGIGTINTNKNTNKGRYKRAYDTHTRNNLWNKVYNKTNKNIRIDILYESNFKDEIIIKEQEFIKLYGKKYLNLGTLVNITDGGEGRNGYKINEKALENLKNSHYVIKNIKCVETDIIYKNIGQLCKDMFNKNYIPSLVYTLNPNSKTKSYKGYHFTTELNKPYINKVKITSFSDRAREKKILCVNNNTIYNSITECCFKLFGKITCRSNIGKAIKNNKKFNNLEFKYI